MITAGDVNRSQRHSAHECMNIIALLISFSNQVLKHYAKLAYIKPSHYDDMKFYELNKRADAFITASEWNFQL